MLNTLLKTVKHMDDGIAVMPQMLQATVKEKQSSVLDKTRSVSVKSDHYSLTR